MMREYERSVRHLPTVQSGRAPAAVSYVLPMSDHLRVFTRALDGFDRVVRLTPDSVWPNPSPCDGWAARDVVGHVIAVPSYVESLARGIEPTLNPYGKLGNLTGDDPVGAWSVARESVLEAVNAPGVLGHTVKTFCGEETLDNALAWNVADTLAHTWDLARAGGVDDHLEDDLVAHATAQALPVIEAMRQPPFFGTAINTNDRSPTAQFLALLGRQIS